jgi:nucleoside-diphosphate-sugar epimerase
MNILIIGGHGYIGSALTKYFHDKNISAIPIGKRDDDYNNLSPEFLNQFTHIILLAGHSSVQMCIGDLSSPWNNNVRNFDNLLKKINPSIPVIYASSSSVYGNRNEKIYVESDTSFDYVNNYDLTKSALDLLAIKHMAEGRYITGLRFGTVNGVSSTLRIDLMINSMVWSSYLRRQVFISNKEINRPILGINDLCNAVNAIVVDKPSSGIYNLSSFNTTVEDVAKKVCTITDAQLVDLGSTSHPYNFSINSDKFKYRYNFQFLETEEEIILNLINNIRQDKCNPVKRDSYFKYD